MMEDLLERVKRAAPKVIKRGVRGPYSIVEKTLNFKTNAELCQESQARRDKAKKAKADDE